MHNAETMDIATDLITQLPLWPSFEEVLDPMLRMRFVLARTATWYVSEYGGDGQFYGLTVDARGERTWGWFSLRELEQKSRVLTVVNYGENGRLSTFPFTSRVQIDASFRPIRASELAK